MIDLKAFWPSKKKQCIRALVQEWRAMTVGELRELLNEYPDEYLIYLDDFTRSFYGGAIVVDDERERISFT